MAHVLLASNTGSAAPTVAAAKELTQIAPDKVDVVVGACRMRMEARLLEERNRKRLGQEKSTLASWPSSDSRRGGMRNAPTVIAYAMIGTHNATVKASELLDLGSSSLRMIP